ncbi:MAG: hypothetical protein A2Z78_01365 [Candidatus Nealsonbacteria bacterium RBG_13_36_15]|uniref:Type IV pilus modification protein PilV n=1 Tax=Candidatus Nealsonbacteria bacterium RBG_13_36_15 TaxID=1801660 RepID=A0A1G2DX53_9BACT|nr:MAG: hypothetical protein A2Z78_01365 [Candidatus Nealsonbacteria bacterium RBG_13_36_15]
MFNSKDQKFRHSEGFTLLEVMMAIFVLTIAVGASYILIQKTFIASSLTQSKLVASHLAQEGVENVRNIRDTNWISANEWNTGISSKYEYVNFLDLSQTKFERETLITEITATTTEVKVNIKWNERGKDYSIGVINYLYDWYGESETLTCEGWCKAAHPDYTYSYCSYIPSTLLCPESWTMDGQLNCGQFKICFCCYPG